MKTSTLRATAAVLPATVLTASERFAKSCVVTALLNGPFDYLDMSSTALQGAESLSPICNYGGTLSVTFTSANLGNLVNTPAVSPDVPYTLAVSGSLLTNASLSVPQVVGNWPAVANAVQTRSMSVTLGSVATIAGIYTDTITASVAPN